jgi:flagellar biosynthesis/type III secretory pathway protein FliH
MAVIKHAERERLARQAVVLDLGDLRRAAEALESRAAARAKQIVDDARAERERLIDGAFEKGFEAGCAEGLAKGDLEGREKGRTEALQRHGAEIASLIEAWRGALERFEAAREDLVLDASAQAPALALSIAERVIKRAVQADPAVIGEQLSAALALLVAPSRLAVFTHPEDLEAAKMVLPSLVERLLGGAHSTLEADPRLSRGSVVIRTPEGAVDASIETQLDRIARAILTGGSGAEVSS